MWQDKAVPTAISPTKVESGSLADQRIGVEEYWQVERLYLLWTGILGVSTILCLEREIPEFVLSGTKFVGRA